MVVMAVGQMGQGIDEGHGVVIVREGECTRDGLAIAGQLPVGAVACQPVRHIRCRQTVFRPMKGLAAGGGIQFNRHAGSLQGSGAGRGDGGPQGYNRCMIQISDSAQRYFRKLLDREAVPGMGVRLRAMEPGTPRADARLEFAEPSDLAGDEWAIDCEGFTLYVAADSVGWLDGADIDLVDANGGQQLTIKAPRIKGQAPAEGSSLVEQVAWVVENEVNPQLASHGGRVAVQEVTADGVVVLRFGGGCHGCGMADVTLKQGIEKTLLSRVPGVTVVRDATDHESGAAPYIARGTQG